MTDTTAYRRRSGVLWRRSLDTTVCLPPDEVEPVTLAGTGPEVWEILRDPHSVVDLAAELSARHGADIDIVTADVRPVIQELAALGLIEPVL